MRAAAISLVLVFAFAGLALAGGSVEELVRDLGSDDFKVREAATAALSEKGAEALPALERAAKDKDPEVRWRAEKALQAVRARAGRPAAPPPPPMPEAPSQVGPPPPSVPPETPPELGDAMRRARERLRGIEQELDRVRPELRDFLKGFGGERDFGSSFQDILEEMERRFRDIDRADRPPRLRDFWTFRFRDGKWELVRPGDPVVDRIGLRTQPPPPVLRAQLKLPEDAPEGLVVEALTSPDGIGARAGIEQWDLILRVDGNPIESDDELQALLLPGEHAIDVVRGGKKMSLQVKVDAPPTAPPGLEEPPAPRPPAPVPPPPSPPPAREPLKKY